MFHNEIEQIEEFLDSDIITEFKKFHVSNIKFISKHESVYISWKENLKEYTDLYDAFTMTAEMHRHFENHSHQHNELVSKEPIFNLYSSLETNLNEVINRQNEVITVDQEPIHFKSLEEDSTLVRIQKKFKSLNFSIGKSIHKTFKERRVNGLFQNQEVDYTWKRKIPLRNLATHHFVNNFLNKFLKSAEVYLERVGKSFIVLLNEQKTIDINFTNYHLQFLSEENASN